MDPERGERRTVTSTFRRFLAAGYALLGRIQGPACIQSAGVFRQAAGPRCAAVLICAAMAACATQTSDLPAAAAVSGLVDAAPRIAVATAYAPEMAALLPDLDNGEEHRLNGVSFWTGELSGQPVVLFKTGVSLVNATMNTQLLIDHFNIRHILVSGVAGGLDPSLSVGDVTVASSWAQYNEGAFLRETSPGQYRPHPGVEPILPAFEFMGTRAVRIARDGDPAPEPKLWFDADPGLIDIAERAATQIQLRQCDDTGLCLPGIPKVVTGGRGVTGSTFMDNARFREYLFETFEAQVVEMETAAIAMVAYANDIPYLAFRSLSDLAGGGNAAENEITAFEHLAAENAAILVHAYLKAYGDVSSSAGLAPPRPAGPAACEIHYSTMPFEPKPLGEARIRKLKAYLSAPAAREEFLKRFEVLSLQIARAMAPDWPLDGRVRINLVWGGYNGGVGQSLSMALDATTAEERAQVTRIGAGLGYVFFQQSVALECREPARGLAETSAFILEESGERDVLSPQTLKSVYGMMMAHEEDQLTRGFTYYPETDEFLVLDLTAAGARARPVMDRILLDLNRFAPEAGMSLAETRRWIRFPFNDWLTSPNGETYIETGLTGEDLALLDKLRGVYLAEIDSLPAPPLQ